MESVTGENFQDFMDGNNFNPMIALAIASRGNHDEAQKILDENPDFKTKVLEGLKEMFVGIEPEEGLEMMMSQLKTTITKNEKPDERSINEKMFGSLTSLIDVCENMDGFNEDRYDINMGLINNFAIIEMLKRYNQDEEFLRVRLDVPKKLLVAIFYKKSIKYELDDNHERIKITKLLDRDDDIIKKKHFQLIEILMNCYLSISGLDLSESSDNIVPEEIYLDDKMVERIQGWLESNGLKTKSAKKQ